MDEILDKLEAYLIKHNISATQFGWACMRNPNIVFRIRKGQMTMNSINEVLRFIEENPKGVIELKKTVKKAVKKPVAKKPKVVKKAVKKKK